MLCSELDCEHFPEIDFREVFVSHFHFLFFSLPGLCCLSFLVHFTIPPFSCLHLSLSPPSLSHLSLIPTFTSLLFPQFCSNLSFDYVQSVLTKLQYSKMSYAKHVLFGDTFNILFQVCVCSVYVHHDAIYFWHLQFAFVSHIKQVWLHIRRLYQIYWFWWLRVWCNHEECLFSEAIFSREVYLSTKQEIIQKLEEGETERNNSETYASHIGVSCHLVWINM